ncbi:hypothetical protein HHK36_008883 [Tetracentron sinense]|uniref:Uncharacterized protein n=1 Tax=Tetracentron sinense TaxID=13715 RepID=A0A834ZC41_TETSI|nr:hypothetical protein HHK36_008883 [Tetracentron sinense]
MAKALGPTGEFFKRRDEWRKHPMLTNNLRHATPGLGIALVAFGFYLVDLKFYADLKVLILIFLRVCELFGCFETLSGSGSGLIGKF